MGVLLGLGDVELGNAVAGEHLRQNVGEILARERDRRGDVVGVLRHLHVVRKRRVGAPVEAVEVGLRERPRELAGAVRPEVEEDRRVARPDPAARGIADHDRLDELVGHAGGVARLDRLDRVVGARADAVHDRVVGPLRAVPAAVAVHRVVAARRPSRRRRSPGRGSASAPCGEVSRPSVKACTCTCSTPSRRASSISACRWRRWLWTPPSETRPSRCSADPRACAAGVDERPVLEEGARLDVVVDPDQVLAHDPPRAQVRCARPRSSPSARRAGRPPRPEASSRVCG